MLEIKRVPVVLQTYTNDCGVSCLLAILRYYGGNAPKEWLMEESGTTQSGVSFYGLKKVANILGFQVEGKKGELSSIPSKDYPFIAHLKQEEQEHFVVVEKISKDNVVVMDPASGHKKIALSFFLEMITGNYLFFYKNGYLKTIETKHTCHFILCNFFKQHKGYLLLLFFLGIFSFFLELAFLFHFKLFISYGVMPGIIQNLIVIGLLFFFIHLNRIYFSFCFELCGLKLEKQLYYLLHQKLCSTLLTLPYLYYKTRSSGSILALFEELRVLSVFPLRLFQILFKTFPLFVFILIYFYLLSPFYFYFLCIGLLLFFLLTMIEKRIYLKKFKENYQLREQRNDFSSQLLTKMEMIKGLHLEKQYHKKQKQLSSRLVCSDYDLSFQEVRQKNIFQVVERILYFAILLLGGMEVVHQKLGFSTFLLLESFLGLALQSGSEFLGIFFQTSHYQKARDYFDELFSLKMELLLPHPNLKLSFAPSILVSHLSYSYGDKVVLQDVNFQVGAGEHIFIYGASGSGKSTLGKILAGFYSIPYGRVSFDSIDLTHFNLDYLRSVVTYTGTFETLFSGSVYDNLTLGRKIPYKEIQSVLKITGLDFVLKEKKISLKTDLLTLGEDLSAGERSRLFVARALLKKSKIYIFDESLDHLDQESERRILKAIFTFYDSQTILYISHRFAAKDLFDHVFSFQEGVGYEEF